MRRNTLHHALLLLSMLLATSRTSDKPSTVDSRGIHSSDASTTTEPDSTNRAGARSMTGPPVPADLTATSTLCGVVNLDWESVGDEFTYDLERAVGNSPEGAEEIATGLASPRFQDRRGECRVMYRYRVRSVASDGTKGGWSEHTTGRQYCRPAVPRNVDATDGERSRIVITWDAVPGATNYRVEYRNNDLQRWEERGTTNQTTRLIDTKSCGVGQVQYRVIAINGCGESAPSRTTTGSCP